MNIINKFLANGDFRNQFFSSLNLLNTNRSALRDKAQQVNNNQTQNKTNQNRRRRRSGATVNGATSREEIRRLQRILRQRISEVVAEEEDKKVKTLRVNDLQRKIAALDRILRQIERIEQENRVQRQRQRRDNTESIYLTSDDLSVGRRGPAGTNILGNAQVPNINVLAGNSVSVGTQIDTPNVDMTL